VEASPRPLPSPETPDLKLVELNDNAREAEESSAIEAYFELLKTTGRLAESTAAETVQPPRLQVVEQAVWQKPETSPCLELQPDSYPPLATARRPEEFEVGQSVLAFPVVRGDGTRKLLQGQVDSVVSFSEPRHWNVQSPGFVSIRFSEAPWRYVGVDVDRMDLIPLDAWEYLKSDDEYREAWFSHGSRESLRERANLEAALDELHFRETRGTLARGARSVSPKVMPSPQPPEPGLELITDADIAQLLEEEAIVTASAE